MFWDNIMWTYLSVTFSVVFFKVLRSHPPYNWSRHDITDILFNVILSDHNLFLCLFSFGHCSLCPVIYGFWLPLWYLQTYEKTYDLWLLTERNVPFKSYVESLIFFLHNFIFKLVLNETWPSETADFCQECCVYRLNIDVCFVASLVFVCIFRRMQKTNF